MSKLLAHTCVCMCLTAMAFAQDSADQTVDFTFKRVGVPKSGAKRLTVQIDPEAQAKALAVKPSLTHETLQDVPALQPITEPLTQALPPSKWDWFWSDVSLELETSGPANLQKALKTLETNRQTVGPRLQDLQTIANAHGLEILKATIGTQVSPAFVLAVISVESAGRVAAQSSAGAQGLMQLIPATAARFGVTDSTDPSQNIAGGVAYLDWLLTHFQGDPIMALAGYNAGENAVTKNNGVPPYQETRDYIPKVLSAWLVARGLCVTPPELLSDGCVLVRKGS